jgi:hypothetical protein
MNFFRPLPYRRIAQKKPYSVLTWPDSMSAPMSSIDLSALIYGSLVKSLLEIKQDASAVTSKLEDIGFRIGRRLAHDFARDRNLARPETPDAVIHSVILPNSQRLIGDSGNYAIIATPTSENSYRLEFSKSVYTKHVNTPRSFAGEDFRFEAILPGALRGIFDVFHYEAQVTLAPPNLELTTVDVRIVQQIPVAMRKDDD